MVQSWCADRIGCCTQLRVVSGTAEESDDEGDLHDQQNHHVSSLGRRFGSHGVDLKKKIRQYVQVIRVLSHVCSCSSVVRAWEKYRLENQQIEYWVQQNVEI